MRDWRENILKHFRAPVHRLTLVADPDSLLLEEKLLATIRQNSFDILPYEDPVAFRYIYETEYRQQWDGDHGPDLVVLLQAPRSDLQNLPFDLLQSGRLLAFSLHDLFPKLSYPVVSDLDRIYLDDLYDAHQRNLGPELGDRASTQFVLRHAYGFDLDEAATPAGLLKLLLELHARGDRLRSRFRAFLLERLRSDRYPASWDPEAWLQNASTLLAFLQGQWRIYVKTLQPTGTFDNSADAAYATDSTVPFSEPDIRAYVAALFLEGKLQPVDVPDDCALEDWRQVGIRVDVQKHELNRLSRLLARAPDEIPNEGATHHAWSRAAGYMADLTVLTCGLSDSIGEALRHRYDQVHLQAEQRFADWMCLRYHTLHSLPFLPSPTMVHHVPHWLASRQAHKPHSRCALIVVDGLALDQWRIVRQIWAEERPSWKMEESTVFAWVPTLTSISRQALFAGKPPKLFPDTWSSSNYDAKHWERFWRDKGVPATSIGYLRNLGVGSNDLNWTDDENHSILLEQELRDLIEDPRTRIAGLVVNKVDNIMHGMQLGTAGMHQQVRLWIAEYQYMTEMVDALINQGFSIWLTSDHGNLTARGMGRPKEGVLAESRGERARVYSDEAFLELARQQSPDAIAWTNTGLPSNLQVLLAPKLKAFLNVGDQAVCHGGIALEEVIVPFVEISRANGS